MWIPKIKKYFSSSVEMKTIYLKRNVVLILFLISSIISTFYLIDYYLFQQRFYMDSLQSSSWTGGLNLNSSNTDFSKFLMKSKVPLSLISSSSQNKCSVTIALILCEDNQYLSYSKTNKESSSKGNSTNTPRSIHEAVNHIAKDFSRQINQTIVLLKSIAIQNRYSFKHYPYLRECVNVIILSDKKSHFDKIIEKITREWSMEFQETLKLNFLPVQYPKGSGWMKKMFRPCATLRLFIPELLPKESAQSIIYLDTDFIFLRSLQSLMNKYFIKGTDEKLVAALAPCLFHYATKANKVPFYGDTGLNAGLMLMNLTRMRDTLWTNKIRMITAMFQHDIKLADQDILNIYFHFFPEELIPISCDWNFRPFQCKEGSYCEDSSLAEGISALHGNALSFTHQGPEPLFNAVFQAFHELRLDDNFSLETFVEDLETKLIKAEEALDSDCVRYGGFSVMVLNRLNNLLRSTELTNN